jgi:hypothetical protein
MTAGVLMVEAKLIATILDLRFVTLLKVLGQNDVSILSHGLHTGLLADGRDGGIADLVRS